MWREVYLKRYMTRCAGEVTNCALIDKSLAESSDGIQIQATGFETLPMTCHVEICRTVSRAVIAWS